MSALTHFDEHGQSRMVDVSEKAVTKREAVARGVVRMHITGIEINYRPLQTEAAIEIEARVGITAKTGVEMEALTAVSIAALTVYDMCKAVDRGMVISDIRLVRKSGGKSGTFEAAST
jgi:cyclic pyranopterin phosphate synthase